MKRCNKCGYSPTRKGARFCGKCGAPIPYRSTVTLVAVAVGAALVWFSSLVANLAWSLTQMVWSLGQRAKMVLAGSVVVLVLAGYLLHINHAPQPLGVWMLKENETVGAKITAALKLSADGQFEGTIEQDTAPAQYVVAGQFKRGERLQGNDLKVNLESTLDRHMSQDEYRAFVEEHGQAWSIVFSGMFDTTTGIFFRSDASRCNEDERASAPPPGECLGLLMPHIPALFGGRGLYEKTNN